MLVDVAVADGVTGVNVIRARVGVAVGGGGVSVGGGGVAVGPGLSVAVTSGEGVTEEVGVGVGLAPQMKTGSVAMTPDEPGSRSRMICSMIAVETG
jgi:hypothetical protein